MRRAELGKLLVLDFHDLRREIALLVVPERIDRQDFHIHGLRIHRGEALLEIDEGFLRPVDRAGLAPAAFVAQQRAGLVEIAMRVHVDGLDPLAVDRDREH
jgi:hypothetical protein